MFLLLTAVAAMQQLAWPALRRRLTRTAGRTVVGAALTAGLLGVQPPGHAAADVVRVYPPAEVSTAFAANAVLLEAPHLRIAASRRDGAGQAEVHGHETDVFYVLQGEAIFVTGGRVSDARDTAPGEIRGSAIEGGTRHRLLPGTVVVVPPDTPHWFESVSPPFLYFVVKAISR